MWLKNPSYQCLQVRIKWKNKLSSSWDLPGGGQQGSSLGLLYGSQSIDSTEFLSPEDKDKFVDDLSAMEILFALFDLQHLCSDLYQFFSIKDNTTCNVKLIKS